MPGAGVADDVRRETILSRSSSAGLFRRFVPTVLPSRLSPIHPTISLFDYYTIIPSSVSSRSFLPIRLACSAILTMTPTQPAPGPTGTGDDGAGEARPPLATGSQHRSRKNHRGGKKAKKQKRRQSFMGLESSASQTDVNRLQVPSGGGNRRNFYSLGQGNLSSESTESHALLDHREHSPMLSRRGSTYDRDDYDFSDQRRHDSIQQDRNRPRRKLNRAHASSDEEGEEMDNDKMPLIRPSARQAHASGYGSYRGDGATSRDGRNSQKSSKSSHRRRPKLNANQLNGPDIDVNNPPSVPGSPVFEHPDQSIMGVNDPMMGHNYDEYGISPLNKRKVFEVHDGDTVIDIPEEGAPNSFENYRSAPMSPDNGRKRRQTTQLQGVEDVCFPQDGMSDIAEEGESESLAGGRPAPGGRRRRSKRWPLLEHLEEWSRNERADRSEGMRSKKVSEPTLINGRLRPSGRNNGWHRVVEDAPYRFTYFNEEFENTIHSQTISELAQEGTTFRDLFIPEPPLLSDSESESESEDLISLSGGVGPSGERSPTDSRAPSQSVTRGSSGRELPATDQKPEYPPLPPPAVKAEPPKRYGNRPTFWLDVLCPTEGEMKAIAKTFGIHPLTSEDILMQEQREKVELFRNYYFVSYRSFEQDTSSEDYLEPVSVYVVVFREGVISFHFSQTPHLANVRRRIRQLKDYLVLSADWVSYAIIDDITDIFVPLIQSIEDEVDDIDDAILAMHSSPADVEQHRSVEAVTRLDHPDSSYRRKAKSSSIKSHDEKRAAEKRDSQEATQTSADMLRRVGDTRKKVMSLYRLMGNKADVIKGFAKRCNEQWDIAPRSEIGLYLGDIQDHIGKSTSSPCL